jgi:hypothetical protein
MLTRRHFSLLALGIPAALALAIPSETLAQAPNPRVEILVLSAKKDPKGPHIDPRVPRIPQLSSPPFSEFNTYSFLDSQTLKLAQPKPADPWKGKPSATYALANGKALEIALLDQLAGKRFQMGLALGKDTPDVVRWNAPAGEPFFVAGPSYKDGILVIGLTFRP